MPQDVFREIAARALEMQFQALGRGQVMEQRRDFRQAVLPPGFKGLAQNAGA
jgi:hypothetical protein